MSTSQKRNRSRWLTIETGIWIALLLSIFAVYSQVDRFEFINLDDAYVSKSAEVEAD